MPDIDEISIDVLCDMIDMGELKKGKIIKDIGRDVSGDTVHLDIYHLRKIVDEIYQVYARKGTKAEFVEVLEKGKDRARSDIDNFFDSLEMKEGEDLFEIVKREKRGDEITIKFKKVDRMRRVKLVKEIADKLIKKMTTEQIKIMLQEGIRRINNPDTLEKVNKALDKKDVKTTHKRGCFKFVVDDIDLMLVP